MPELSQNESMIRLLLTETPLPTNEAATRCGVDTDAVIRWITRGKPGRDGVVRLEGYHAGRSWMTSVEALARFLACSPRLPREAPQLGSGRRTGRKRLERALARA